MHPQYDEFLRLLSAWARDCAGKPDDHSPCRRTDHIILIGSQARSARPADRWSDLDLMLLVDDPLDWINDNTWFERFGRVANHFNEIVPLHFNGWQWLVKRVLYADGRDVDFSLLPQGRLDDVLQANRDILARGYRVLHSQDAPDLEARLQAVTAACPPPASPPPNAAELDELVRNLLYHVIWAGKKTLRGELWVACGCINVYMRDLLLQLVEAHNQAGGQPPTALRYNGRFLEQRTPAQTLSELAGCFAHYDAADALAALGRIFALTERLDRELCAHLGVAFSPALFAHTWEMFAAMQTG